MRREVLTSEETALALYEAEVHGWALRPWWSRLWRWLTRRAP